MVNEKIAAITIGRNEGERLRLGLESLVGVCDPIIYVDSNSTDDSVAMARGMGVEVVELDPSRPITIPRARNEGFERLMEMDDSIRYVQFLDGDCVLSDGWLDAASTFLDDNEAYALVSGRRRELDCDQNVFTMLADMDWDTPIGEARTCHGDHMMRAEAFRQINGYNPDLIAGEEEDMCYRFRQEGWQLYRLDAEMSVHDISMTQPIQWWRRSIRTGFVYMELNRKYGKSAERMHRKRVRSFTIWALVIPLIAVAMAVVVHPVCLALLLLYPVQVLRITRSTIREGYPPKHARVFALACVIGYFPQLYGAMKYISRTLRGGDPSSIHYK